MDTSGSSIKRLTNNEVYDGAPEFSTDGKMIAYCSLIPISSEKGTKKDGGILKMNTDGTAVKRLTNRMGFDCLPDWSPDGKLIVFHGCDTAGCQLYTIDIDSTSLKHVTYDEYDNRWPK